MKGLKEFLEYHKLNCLGSYFINLVGYSRGKGSYKIYYNEESEFKNRFNFIKKKLEKENYKIYKISKEQKANVTNFVKRIYFKKDIDKNK